MGKKEVPAVPTGREVHLSPEQCELFYRLLNSVGASDAGGLRYTICLTDLIKSVGSVRVQDKIDEREKFGLRYKRVKAGEEHDPKRQEIEDELTKWRDGHDLTNECFPSKKKTIAVIIPPESNKVLLNTLLFHSRIQVGSGLMKLVELCDKFELRGEFTAEAAKLDAEDKKAKKAKK